MLYVVNCIDTLIGAICFSHMVNTTCFHLWK